MNQSFNLAINSFVKNYKNKTITIPNILISKQVTLIVGKNGCGKSTLLKAIAKQIYLKNHFITEKTISYMPENPSFPKDITVKDFLKELYHKSSNDYDYNSLLLLFRLKVKEDLLIRSLSKGMKTKLNAIQCLMKNVDLYCLDEPFSGLDEESKKTLMQIISSRERKQFIVTSHEVLNWDNDKEVIKL